jgi:hypothetical protein
VTAVANRVLLALAARRQYVGITKATAAERRWPAQFHQQSNGG